MKEGGRGEWASRARQQIPQHAGCRLCRRTTGHLQNIFHPFVRRRMPPADGTGSFGDALGDPAFGTPRRRGLGRREEAREASEAPAAV